MHWDKTQDQPDGRVAHTLVQNDLRCETRVPISCLFFVRLLFSCHLEDRMCETRIPHSTFTPSKTILLLWCDLLLLVCKTANSNAVREFNQKETVLTTAFADKWEQEERREQKQREKWRRQKRRFGGRRDVWWCIFKSFFLCSSIDLKRFRVTWGVHVVSRRGSEKNKLPDRQSQTTTSSPIKEIWWLKIRTFPFLISERRRGYEWLAGRKQQETIRTHIWVAECKTYGHRTQRGIHRALVGMQ